MYEIHDWCSSSKAKEKAIGHNRIKKIRKNNVHDHERDKMSDKVVDRISLLPNDILIYLLSFVEMKTAGRTSLLSRRWRYVWTLLPDLVFEDVEFFLQHKKTSTSEIQMFFNWVNQVLISHRAPYLNTLRIHFPVWGSYGDGSIDKWIKFALRKNVVNFELNLATFLGRRSVDMKNFVISENNHPTFRHYNDLGTTLKSLHLEAIFVEGRAVENVLCNSCPNVERLTMKACNFVPKMSNCYRARPMRHSKVVISSLKLKHLEISRCSFESIQIFAPKLTCFVLIAEHKALVEYTDVSSVVDVTFKAAYCIHNNLNVLSNFSHRLQKLSIYWIQVSYAILGFPHLHKGNLLALIEACPLLHAFKLEAYHCKAKQGVATTHQQGGVATSDSIIMRPHKHLKVVEFVGFDGSSSMVELAICLTQHSPELKQIIFDPRCSQLVGGFLHLRCDQNNVEGFNFARRQARLFANQIRQGVDVVIL